MTITRYRKLPVEVDTVQWTGDNEAELIVFTGNRFEALEGEDRADDPEMTAQVLDVLHSTWVGVKTGQHIVRGVKGEYYPIAGDVLAETYERVDDGTAAPEETVPRVLFDENARRHQAALTRVDELLATIERVRALCADPNHSTMVFTHTVLAALDEPDPAATEATELGKTTRALSALHRSAEDTVTRVIALYEQWVTAGPPPLGASLARWWDTRLTELHHAIAPPAEQRAENFEGRARAYEQCAQDRAARIARLTTDRDRLRTRLAEQETETMRQHERAQQAEAERDGAYRERAHLVALLAAMTDGAVIASAVDVEEPGWQIVYLTIGGRQASWRISPRDADLFACVPHVDVDHPSAQWDGHTTEDKYADIRQHTRDLFHRCGPACAEGHTYTGPCEYALLHQADDSDTITPDVVHPATEPQASSPQQVDEPCPWHPTAPVIGGLCGGCTQYPADMKPATPASEEQRDVQQ